MIYPKDRKTRQVFRKKRTYFSHVTLIEGEPWQAARGLSPEVTQGSRVPPFSFSVEFRGDVLMPHGQSWENSTFELQY